MMPLRKSKCEATVTASPTHISQMVLSKLWFLNPAIRRIKTKFSLGTIPYWFRIFPSHRGPHPGYFELKTRACYWIKLLTRYNSNIMSVGPQVVIKKEFSRQTFKYFVYFLIRILKSSKTLLLNIYRNINHSKILPQSENSYLFNLKILPQSEIPQNWNIKIWECSPLILIDFEQTMQCFF